MKRKHLYGLIFAFIVILFGSLIWNIIRAKTDNERLVMNKARAFFEQILIARAWNAEHGGVYVPITDRTKPNPYLKDSLRDIVTLDGFALTKVNPAFMTRQISETSRNNADIHFNITSLNPIRPQNYADEWEKKALESFHDGKKEVIELIKTPQNQIYRYMAPLYTEAGCLQCHAEQGYKIGDIRGGISVSFKANNYIDAVNKQVSALSVVHLLVLLVGFLGLGVYYMVTRKYLKTIETKNLELKESNRVKDKFFSIIAHDLKSPFNTILGFSEHLKNEAMNESQEGITTAAKVIFESSLSAVDLLNNLLTWSQIESGRMHVHFENFELSKILDKEVVLLSGAAAQKSIEIHNQVQTEQVYCDKEMIKSILRNLISNAIKFTRIGGEINIRSNKKEGMLYISISDNGVGIAEKDLSRLFTISESYSTEGTEKEQGTGLGLVLCREFVEKNNGEIKVESKLNQGTTFTFSIPLSQKHATNQR